MQATLSPPPTRSLPMPMLIAAGFLIQIISIPFLWNHQSDSGSILGQYSSRYIFILIANIILIFGWGMAFLRRKQTIPLLEKLTFYQRLRIIVFSGAAIAILWLIPVIEAPIKQYAATNFILLTACLLYSFPDREARRQWGWVGWTVLAVLFIPTLLTILTARSFSPDEAMWADYSTSPFEASGLYSRTWLQEPMVINPGLGWSIAAYGSALENVAFDIKIGRLWNFAINILAFVGIGAVTWRLYGGRAAAVNIVFAALSQRFIPIYDYRPDHQLPLAAMLILFTALQARYSKSYRGLWDFACGLAATLSLQLHAAGVVFAAGFSLFYLVEFGLDSYRQRRMASIRPLIGFGIGALIGTGVFYWFNIQPVGGLQAYMDFLIRTQWRSTRVLRFLNWTTFERMVVLLSLGYIVWRRSRADRLFIGMFACVIIAIAFLDSAGYYTTFEAFYIVPIGAAVVYALPDGLRIPEGKSMRVVILGLALLTMMTAQRVGEFIDWSSLQHVVQTGELPPFFYEELKPQLLPLLQNDDVVASTHQLIWTIPRKPQLVFVGAEQAAMTRWNLTDPVEVWEKVKPTAIVQVANQMNIEKGLETYMERHHFIVCKILTVMNVEVTVFRETCLPSSRP